MIKTLDAESWLAKRMVFRVRYLESTEKLCSHIIFVSVDQDDIAGDEFCVNITGVHIISGVNNTNRAHHDFVLLSVLVFEGGEH